MWNEELNTFFTFCVFLFSCCNRHHVVLFQVCMNFDNGTRLLSYMKSNFVIKDIFAVILFVLINSDFFIIFWDFLTFYQIFLSPQVKRWEIITYKHGIYKLPHELPNDLRLVRKSGNITKVSKPHRAIAQCPPPSRHPTRKPEPAPNTPRAIAGPTPPECTKQQWLSLPS